jgi:hypothetical protein
MAREVLDQVLRSLAQAEPTEEPTRLLPLTTGDEAAEYLTGVTTGRFPYDAGRVRAAQALLPHQRPKLTAIATTSMDGKDFASMLERAITRSKAPLLLEHRSDQVIEPAAPPGIRGRSGAR